MMLRILAVLAIALAPALAYSHDARHPELNNWFEGLHSGKGPCCSNADGNVVIDADWESKDGHYRVKLEGQWVDVPDEAVIKEPNRDGRTIVWPGGTTWNYNMPNAKTLTVRCFMPGSMT
jgi:hypothetical protein